MRFGKRILGVTLVSLLSVPLLAGCGQTFRIATPHGTATCKVAQSGNGGSCAMNGQTASVVPGSGHRHHHTATPTPTAPTVTASPVTATPTPQSTFDANAVRAVEDCVNKFPTSVQDTLVSFSTSASARSDMAVCLQMPPQTVALFLHLLFKYAYAAYVRGDFDTEQGQLGFTDTTQGDTIPAAVIRCDKHYTPN